MNTIDNIDLYINDKSSRTSGLLKGIPVVNGIVVGKAYVLENNISIFSEEKITKDEIENEILRLKQAYNEIRKDFEETYEKVKSSNANIQKIIETNLLIIQDTYIEQDIIKSIKDLISAESSVVKCFEHQKSFFKNSKDPLLREKSFELDHIKQKLLIQLKHLSINYADASNKILVADNISPTDLTYFVENGINGLITEVGGIASHVSIMSRAYELPCIIGIKDVTNLVQNNDSIVLDGFSGNCYYNPSFSILKEYKMIFEKIKEHKRKLGTLIKKESITKDGKRIIVSANADKYEDIVSAIMTGAEGIGLFRSELSILQYNIIPDEETQFSIYNKCAQVAYPREITIRVFDIGSDKYTEGIPFTENNPALGFRGIRYLLARKDIFRAQVRAILRASSLKNIRILIPMITSLKEVIESKQLIENEIQELINNEISIDKNIKIGFMIETPAAALLCEDIISNSDFISIGTNDLIQYTLAADRNNTLVNDYYDSFHPAVLKLVKLIIETSNKNKKPVSICGELAGHSAATNLLIGLGVNELSVAPPLVLELKNRINNSDYSKLKKMSTKVINHSDSNEILKDLETVSF